MEWRRSQPQPLLARLDGGVVDGLDVDVPAVAQVVHSLGVQHRITDMNGNDVRRTVDDRQALVHQTTAKAADGFLMSRLDEVSDSREGVEFDISTRYGG